MFAIAEARMSGNERPQYTVFVIILCGGSSCSVTSSSSGRCSCEQLKHPKTGVVRDYALCDAIGATSCSRRDGWGFSCDVEGPSSKCSLITASQGNVHYFIPMCRSMSAKRCSMNLGTLGQCEVIGSGSRCDHKFFSADSKDFLVPLCHSRSALQCSMSCGSMSCDVDCTNHRKSSRCECVYSFGVLQPKCRCL
ncbi:hypothetical protein P9112_012969 [Eukaryota sp. TZLM1-RC]